MKKRLAVFALMGFFMSSGASAIEFAARLSWGGIEGYRSIYTIDTVRMVSDEIFSISVPGFYEAITTAPDGRIFVGTAEVERDADDTRIAVLRIVPIAPRRTGAGEIEYTQEDPLFEHRFPADAWGTTEPISGFSGLAVKKIDAAGNYRVYFSTSCGACADGQIYYVDDTGAAQPYYRVRLSDMTIPSCPGSSGYWGGAFVFDDSENLYLSSGNHCPSSLYIVDRAGADAVAGAPAWLYDRTDGSMQGMDFDSGSIYFVDGEATIYKLDLATLSESEVFTNPAIESISSVALLRTPAIMKRPVLRGPERFLAPPFARLDLPLRAKTPDLGITSLHTGAPTILDQGQKAIIPLRLIIENSGTAILVRFKTGVTVTVSDHGKPRPVPFSVACSRDKHFVWTDKLPANSQVGVAGEVFLRSPDGEPLYGREITVTARVDSCVDDIAVTGHCRVKEGNEKNNDRSIHLKLGGRNEIPMDPLKKGSN